MMRIIEMHVPLTQAAVAWSAKKYQGTTKRPPFQEAVQRTNRSLAVRCMVDRSLGGRLLGNNGCV
jgi:hypothetical protein